MHTYLVPYLSFYIIHSLFLIGSICIHPVVNFSFTWHSCHLHKFNKMTSMECNFSKLIITTNLNEFKIITCSMKASNLVISRLFINIFVSPLLAFRCKLPPICSWGLMTWQGLCPSCSIKLAPIIPLWCKLQQYRGLTTKT